MAKIDARQALNDIKNGERSPAKLNMSAALTKAIGSLGTELLCMELEFLCREFPAVVPTLEGRLLVKGKDVVRYHVDEYSEDDENSENEESASGSDNSDGSESERESKKRKPIAIGDEEYTARMAMCENCNQEFDVTLNERGDCLWHPEYKSVDYESDFWADHDENCHGPYDSFIDDPDFASGFIYECCDKPGDDEGCKSTKHKAAVNILVPAPPPVLAQSKKRKAEEETLRTNAKKGRQ